MGRPGDAVVESAADEASGVRHPASPPPPFLPDEDSLLARSTAMLGGGGRFTFVRRLGSGTFGQVVQATEAIGPAGVEGGGGLRTPLASRSVAIKLLPRGGDLRASQTYVMREVLHQGSLRHPCVVMLHAVALSPTHLGLVMEHARGGDLFGYLVSPAVPSHRLPEREARRVLQQLALGVAYCHARGVANRDLKLENLLLAEEPVAPPPAAPVAPPPDARARAPTSAPTLVFAEATLEAFRKGSVEAFGRGGVPGGYHIPESRRAAAGADGRAPQPWATETAGTPQPTAWPAPVPVPAPAPLPASSLIIKICDWGFSKHELNSVARSGVGTPVYMAPEVILGARGYDAKRADMWSVGVILYVLLAGRYPYPPGSDPRRAMRDAVTKDARLPSSVSAGLSAECVDLVGRLLTRDPSRRLSADGVLTHPWFLRDLPPSVAGLNEERLRNSPDLTPAVQAVCELVGAAAAIGSPKDPPAFYSFEAAVPHVVAADRYHHDPAEAEADDPMLHD